jgi:hypothetical protein
MLSVFLAGQMQESLPSWQKPDIVLNIHMHSMLNQLINASPKAIVLNSAESPLKSGGIPMASRFLAVNRLILKNYFTIKFV